MLGRGGRREGAGADRGDGGLLRREEEEQEQEQEQGEDAGEGEGAGLLPMDPEKTLAMVVCL
jgi:hypothetical protein